MGLHAWQALLPIPSMANAPTPVEVWHSQWESMLHAMPYVKLSVMSFLFFDAAKLYDKMQKVKWKQSFFLWQGLRMAYGFTALKPKKPPKRMAFFS